MTGRQPVLLEVEGLKTHFPVRGTFVDRLLGREAGSVKAVDGVSFEVREREVLGIVGESGSGKTTLGRTLLNLVGATDGRVSFEGRATTGLPERDFRPLRREMQIVFQDPHASLNPAMTIGASVGHPLVIHGVTKDDHEIRKYVTEALERVGLSPPDQFMAKYPGDLSGGQKQRAVIARAIILHPRLLIADEPVSMLDMSVRAKILELMLSLKQDLDLTYIYITHDLATAKFFCDRIAIMYLGRIVEIGPSEAIFADPKHPYTVSLLKAIPEPDPRKSVPRDIPRGEVPDAVSPPLGCSFHPRCPHAFEVCGWEGRDLRDLLEARWARMKEEEYEREQAMIADLDVLDMAATEVDLPTAPGAAEDVLGLLESMRTGDPEEPFWKGVAEMSAAGDRVVIRFHEGIDPGLYEEERVRVACLLYNDEALDRARVLAGRPAGGGSLSALGDATKEV